MEVIGVGAIDLDRDDLADPQRPAACHMYGAVDFGRIGAQAAEFLIDRIENPRTAGSETATIPVKLLEGESMGICPVKTDAANS